MTNRRDFMKGLAAFFGTAALAPASLVALTDDLPAALLDAPVTAADPLAWLEIEGRKYALLDSTISWAPRDPDNDLLYTLYGNRPMRMDADFQIDGGAPELEKGRGYAVTISTPHMGGSRMEIIAFLRGHTTEDGLTRLLFQDDFHLPSVLV